MIRGRCPYVVDLALKWCQAKERWVSRVYNDNVQLYKTPKERSDAARYALGIRVDGVQDRFIFATSINLDLLGFYENYTGEKCYWIWVNSWVNWFTENYKYWENAYNCDSDQARFKIKFRTAYLEYLGEDCDKLANYLLKAFDKWNISPMF